MENLNEVCNKFIADKFPMSAITKVNAGIEKSKIAY